MKKGVVLEINSKFVTFLTPEGEFLRSRKVREHYEIGEEIDFFPLSETFTSKKSFFQFEKIRVALATSVAAVLLFFTVFTFYDSQEVYAYMSIDINPSLEAGVDKKLRVVSLEAYNDEGELVLNNLEEWINQPIDSVTKAIIQKSKESGYYQDGAEIIIATVILEDEGDTLEKELNTNVKSLVSSYKDVNVPITVLNSTLKEREVALQKGISIGKYIKETILASEKESEKHNSMTDNEENDASKEKEKLNKGIEKDSEQIDQKQDNEQASTGKEKEDVKVKVEIKDKVKVETGVTNQNESKGPPKAVQEIINKAKEKRDNKDRANDRDDDDEDNEEKDDNDDN